MKKKISIFIILLLFFQLQVVQAADIYSQQSWIGAYFLSKSNSTDFSPFLDIRKVNTYGYSPGSAIRNILADYIIIQKLNLVERIDNIDQLTTTEELLSKVKNIDFQNKAELQLAILEADAILRLKNEIAVKNQKLKMFLNEEYGDFLYRFYHFQVSMYEKARTLPPPKFTYNSKEEKEVVNEFYRDWKGDYTQKLKVKPNEVRDSMLITERINSMLPITPLELIQNKDSPLISYERKRLNSSQRRNLMQQFSKKGLSVKFIWKKAAGLAELDVDRNFIGEIISSLSIFDNQILDYLNSKYTDLYGGEFKYNSNLSQLLMKIKDISN